MGEQIQMTPAIEEFIALVIVGAVYLVAIFVYNARKPKTE